MPLSSSCVRCMGKMSNWKLCSCLPIILSPVDIRTVRGPQKHLPVTFSSAHFGTSTFAKHEKVLSSSLTTHSSLCLEKHKDFFFFFSRYLKFGWWKLSVFMPFWWKQDTEFLLQPDTAFSSYHILLWTVCFTKEQITTAMWPFHLVQKDHLTLGCPQH